MSSAQGGHRQPAWQHLSLALGSTTSPPARLPWLHSFSSHLSICAGLHRREQDKLGCSRWQKQEEAPVLNGTAQYKTNPCPRPYLRAEAGPANKRKKESERKTPSPSSLLPPLAPLPCVAQPQLFLLPILSSARAKPPNPPPPSSAPAGRSIPLALDRASSVRNLLPSPDLIRPPPIWAWLACPPIWPCAIRFEVGGAGGRMYGALFNWMARRG
ncbi:hypothetical protein HU200_050899 [Digitaria exilis]|uniref:Uncharacterized protein n=1 Tax=Digitaria exilis TaxID=1010633 RepID=A0A835E5J9_9POAL|nr:hypothetical protein HU200_050899 [Digitaria exilis]